MRTDVKPRKTRPESAPSLAERYAHLTAQKRLIEEQMEEIKAAAIMEVQSQPYKDRGAASMDTSYGRLVVVTKSKFIFDQETQERIKEKKSEVKYIEDEAVANGKAEIEITNYLALKSDKE